MGLLRWTRQALALPPGEALRTAQRLARMRAGEARCWVGDAFGGDPLGEVNAGSRLGLGSARERSAFLDSLFGPEAVLPLTWAPDAAALVADPGDGPPSTQPAAVDRIRRLARAALEHRFDLLGSGPVRVEHGLEADGFEGHVYRMAPGERSAADQVARMRLLLPARAFDGYVPVDWQTDFRSGYRWDPGIWYRRIPQAPLPGVDIKIPWELSRLQHAGVLGLAWRLEPGSEEGRAAPAEFVAQVVDWVAANPVRRGVNWSSTMDVALRAVSWLAGLSLFHGAAELTPEFRWLLARALHVHGEHIARNLESDAVHSGDHYLSSLLGLIAIGAALPGVPAADTWIAFGLHELVAEAERQFLPDGGHVGGSTAYHAFVLEVLLVATCIAQRLPPARRQALARSASASARGRRQASSGEAPDLLDPAVFPPVFFARLSAATELLLELTGETGLLPQVGDHDSGRVVKLVPAEDPRDWRQVLALAGGVLGDDRAAQLGRPYALNAALLMGDSFASLPRDNVVVLSGVVLPEAGERGGAAAAPAVAAATHTHPRVAGPVRHEDTTGEDGTLTLFPHAGLAVGRAGPLRLLATFAQVPKGSSGGHHHNDLLSFELAYGGVPLVVDGGTWVYTALPERRDEFRRTDAHSTISVGGREQRQWPARDISLFMVTADADVTLREAEPGRLELSCEYGMVSHLREWHWTASRLSITDEVTADVAAALVLNLAPHVTVEGLERLGSGDFACQLVAGPVRASVRLSGVAIVEVVGGVYSIGYGRRVPNQALVARLARGYCETVIELSGARVEEGAER